MFLRRPLIATALLIGLLAIAAAACGSDDSGNPGDGTSTQPSSTSSPLASGLPAECSQDYVFTPIQGVVPVVISSELAIGQSRFAFALETGDKLLNNAHVNLTLEPCVEGQTPIQTDGTWEGLHTKGAHSGHVHGTQEVSEAEGVYAAEVSFPVAGRWVAQFNIEDPEQSPRVIFDVRDKPITPAIGAPAPSVQTPVLGPGVDIKTVTSANPPNEAFISTSLDKALTEKKPILLMIATPAFCRSRVCGPQYEEMSTLYDTYKDRVTFIQVEPYPLDASGQPTVDQASGQWQLSPIVTAYNLPGEPWTFIIDASGKVAAKFEGLASADEVTAALDGVVGGA